MFDKKKYINSYNKEHYKDFKIRINKEEGILIDFLSKKKSINKYLITLIWNDFFVSHEHNFINDNIKINFKLSRTMQNLCERAEKADYLDDYGLYMNLADAIDSQAKKETTHGQMRESEWNMLASRYRL